MPHVSIKYKKKSLRIGNDLFGSDTYCVQKIPVLPIGLSYVPKVATKKSRLIDRIFTKYISFNQGYSIHYELPEHKSYHSNIEGLRVKQKYVGELSKKAMSRLRKALQWFITISSIKTVYSMKEKKQFKFKLAFLTLTLSSKQVHSDEYIKKHMLQPFLKWLIREHNCVNYIWKAEAQKNGNIHFHITINKFVHHRAVKCKWNAIQFNHGYIEKDNNGKMKVEPNSTDIHAVKNDKLIVGYFLKYMAKNEKDKRKITGRLWDCSTTLKDSSIVLNHFQNEYYELSD